MLVQLLVALRFARACLVPGDSKRGTKIDVKRMVTNDVWVFFAISAVGFFATGALGALWLAVTVFSLAHLTEINFNSA